MVAVECPSFTYNPIFSESLETTWILQIHCQNCSLWNFSQECNQCLDALFKIAKNQNKLVSKIVFQQKWELDEVGTEIIFDLWQNRNKIEQIISNEGLVADSKNFSAIIEFLKKKFENSEYPSDFFVSRKLKLRETTLSFLQYAFNFDWGLEKNYEDIFGPFLKRNKNSNNVLREELEVKQSTYFLTDMNLFQVEIYDTPDLEKFYKLIPICEKETYQHFNSIIEVIASNIEIMFDPDYDLEEQISQLKKKTLFQLYRSFPGLNLKDKKIIAMFSALYYLNFTKLYGLLADENIEEYFLDSPDDCFYLDHAVYGRCRTNIQLNPQEIESFKSISKIQSKKRLEINYPSLKYSLNLFETQFRITIDIAPVSLNAFSMTIRRPRKFGWSLSQLIQNGTLSLEIAAFLLWCAKNGINITVTGETDTGKTTLINAIDKLLPRDLRRIYIEDVKESLARDPESHQVFFQASDSEENKDKSHLIISLLHRSPDFVYLGEILSQDEARAMFHALSVGLKGLQTIHSQSIESLINRWIFHYQINPISLESLGIIVLMKKIGNRRIIVEIAEIIVEGDAPFKQVIVFFDAKKNSWVFSRKFFNSQKVEEKLKFQKYGESDLMYDLKMLEKTVLEN